MTLHDKAYELVKEIKESSEFSELEKSIAQINADPESKRMVDGFRERQMIVQQKMMAGESPDKEEMEQLERLYEVLNTHTSINHMFEAERRLGLVMDDINRIISSSLEGLYG